MLLANSEQVLAIPAAEAVAAMWDAVAAHGNGELCAPPRSHIELGEAAMPLTAGRLPGVASGFRLYSSAPEAADELTLIFRAGGAPVGVVLGRDLGRRRTGALGGVAAKLLARPDASDIGLVGAGEQAFTQLWAISAVRDLRRVRVFSRRPTTALAFARRCERELELAVQIVTSAQQAVTDADIVVLSTPSAEPLIQSSWLRPGAHEHTLGPKGVAEGECPLQLVRDAAVLVSDKPAQLYSMAGARPPWPHGPAAV